MTLLRVCEDMLRLLKKKDPLEKDLIKAWEEIIKLEKEKCSI